jgi:hypothetical protein
MLAIKFPANNAWWWAFYALCDFGGFQDASRGYAITKCRRFLSRVKGAMRG